MAESQKITNEEALEICDMALRCLMARRDEICQQHPEFSIENCLCVFTGFAFHCKLQICCNFVFNDFTQRNIL